MQTEGVFINSSVVSAQPWPATLLDILSSALG